MPSRLNYIIQMTTSPDDPAVSRPHTAGWSEGMWFQAASTPIASIRLLGQTRSGFLPREASIIGYRQQVFTIQGNRLIPGGTASGALSYPGMSQWTCDIPQMALSVKVQGAGVANTSKKMCRGIPDSMVVGGEYSPTVAFQNRVLSFFERCKTLGAQFIGRDLALPSVRIISLAANVLATDLPTGAINGDYVRILKTYTTLGLVLNGAFRVSAGGGTNNLTLEGLPAGVAVEGNGRARKDTIGLFAYDDAQTGRITTKRVGRPFEGYRGRASKRARA